MPSTSGHVNAPGSDSAPDGGPESVAAGTPLGEVTDELDRRGSHGQFQALEGGDLRCLTCDYHFPASETTATQSTRLEGASDPADGAIVVPLECPSCGTNGALIAHYGPEASAAEADVLTSLPRE